MAARTLLDKKLIRHTRWLHDTSDLRQGSDYVAEYHVSGEEAEKTLKNAELFLDEVKKVL